jgi:hypothetical protein
MAGAAKKSGKNRKYDRNRKSAQNVRYITEHRCAKNKARKAARHMKRMVKQSEKVLKVPHGTQRRKNRIANGKTK